MLKYELLKQLCAAFFNNYPTEEKKTIYYLQPDKEKKVEEGQINRIRGNPLSIKSKLQKNNSKHIFTLDLNSMPLLKAFVGEDYRAMTFFSNEEEDTFENIFITENDILEITPTQDSYGFDIIAIDVPLNVFNYLDIMDDYLDTDEEASDHFFDTGELVLKDPRIISLKEIYDILYSAPAYVLGDAMYIQDERKYSDFLMQFDGRFGNMGLGDAGVMYLFKYKAFYLTH